MVIQEGWAQHPLSCICFYLNINPSRVLYHLILRDERKPKNNNIKGDFSVVRLVPKNQNVVHLVLFYYKLR